MVLSPAIIGAVVIACLCIVAQIVADVRRVAASRRLYGELFTQLRRQQAKPVTVVIDLRRAAETILPLLNHLQQQKYAKLTVIVILRQTAGSRAQAKLATYRRTKHYPQLRLVKHRKGMTILSVVRRYAPRGLVTQLTASDRVGRDFFFQASLQFADVRVGAVLPRIQMILTTRLSSAFQAVTFVWNDFKKSLMTPLPLDETIQPGAIYRVKALLGGTLPTTRTIYSQTIYLHRQPHTNFLEESAAGFGQLHAKTSWLIVVFALLCLYSAVVSGGTLGYFLLALYCLLFGFRLGAIKGYSPLDKLTLVLFSPLSVLFFVGVGVVGLIRKLWRGFFQAAVKKTNLVKS
jgi:hypothetical protein